MLDDNIASVLTDPQNDFLSKDGVAWELVGASVRQNGTVANIERLLQGPTAGGVPIFVSPHYYDAHDHRWQFGGTLEQRMHEIKTFDRRGPLTLEGFEGSPGGLARAVQAVPPSRGHDRHEPAQGGRPRGTTTRRCSCAGAASTGWSWAACRPTSA